MTIEKGIGSTNRGAGFRRVAMAVLAALLLAGAATAQVTGLYYQEVKKDSRIYVFNTFERYKSFQSTGEMGTGITLIARGPDGETVVAENDTALDLFMFKHSLPAYDRPAPKPPAAAPDGVRPAGTSGAMALPGAAPRVRVSAIPPSTAAAPRDCPGVQRSPRVSHANVAAITGVKFW